MAFTYLRRLTMGLLAVSFARCAAMLRVLAYSVVVLAGLLAYGVHSARGAVGERSLALGRELENMRDVLGNTKMVVLNGQRMMLSTAVVPLDVRATLDRFEALCRGRPHALATAVELVPRVQVASADIPLVRRLGILRSDDARDGIVACVVRRGDGVRDLSDLVHYLSRTLDLGLLGDFFYAYARDASTGGKTQSHVVTSWTRGSFRPAAMFPANGDAPGSDSTLAARPGSSRRILSGVAVGAPYAIRVYESAEPLGAVLSGFDTHMAGLGWTRVQEPGIPEGARAYVHGTGVTSLVTAAKSNQSKRTVISLVEMGAGNPGAPSRGAE